MRQRRKLIGAGIALLLMASGCEDLPTTTTAVSATSPSPSPSASAAANASARPGTSPAPTGAASPSPSVGASATPSPSPSASAGASPSPSPSATATPTPTPSATPVPLYTDIPMSFEQPLAGTDFSDESLTIRIKVNVPPSDKVEKIQVFYDNRLLATQTSDSDVFEITGWNPNVANSVDNADTTPVAYGYHRLKATVRTERGVVDSKLFSFNKPFVFRGWKTDLVLDQTTVPIPPMLAKRSHFRAYGRLDRLFAFMGGSNSDQPEASIESLNTSTQNLSWEYRNLGGLAWREKPGVAGMNNKILIVGGLEQSATGGTQASNQVTVYDLYQMTATAGPTMAPPGAVPVADPAVVIHDNYLYVVGGTTNGLASSATGNTYRLALTRDGVPVGTDWEARASLPQGARRFGSSLVAHNGALYLLGGTDERGNRSEFVFRYDPASNEWATVRFLHRGLSHAAAVVMGGDIWLFGGYTNLFPPITNEVVRYRPESGSTTTFSEDVNLPKGRAGMGLAVVNGQVYLMGGSELDDQGNEVPSNEVLRADTL